MTPAQLAEAMTRQPETAGLILDFDGTLAPIVDDPTASAMPARARDALAVLADALAVVAVVSGRPAEFLAERAAVPGVRLLGLYGTQEWRDGEAIARPEAEQWLPALADARALLADAIAVEEGVLLEDKGLAVAVHWRNAGDRRAAEERVTRLVAEVAGRTGLATEPGKFVAELRPDLGWDKGTSVAMLVDELDLATVVYAGDDRGDLPALAAARAAGGYALVVDHGEETPQQVREAADVVLDGTGGVADWLTDLATVLQRAA